MRVNTELTEKFDCSGRLRQGCVLSPNLFLTIISEVAPRVVKLGKHGMRLLPGLREFFIPLFADDFALLSSTPQGQQTRLNCKHKLCEHLDLEVNIDQNKLMVFRNGRYPENGKSVVNSSKS